MKAFALIILAFIAIPKGHTQILVTSQQVGSQLAQSSECTALNARKTVSVTRPGMLYGEYVDTLQMTDSQGSKKITLSYDYTYMANSYSIDFGNATVGQNRDGINYDCFASMSAKRNCRYYAHKFAFDLKKIRTTNEGHNQALSCLANMVSAFEALLK